MAQEEMKTIVRTDTKYICLNVFLCFIFFLFSDCFLSFSAMHLRFLLLISHVIVCVFEYSEYHDDDLLVPLCCEPLRMMSCKTKTKKEFYSFFLTTLLFCDCYCCSFNLHIYTCTDGLFFSLLFSECGANAAVRLKLS